MSDAPNPEALALADDLRAAGVEVGYVGGESARYVFATRLLALGWTRPTPPGQVTP